MVQVHRTMHTTTSNSATQSLPGRVPFHRSTGQRPCSQTIDVAEPWRGSLVRSHKSWQDLASYGRVRGLASEDVHDLVQMLAASCASWQWARMGSRDPEEATATLKRLLYRSLGFMAMPSQARLKLAGLGHFGSSAACARRSDATAAHARRREAYQLHLAAARRSPNW